MKRIAACLTMLFLFIALSHSAMSEKREIQINENTTKIEYLDEQGNLTAGIDGYAYSLRTLDSFGNVILEQYFSAEDAPFCYKGSYYGVAYSYNELNQCIEITYLNAEGKPSLNASGYAIIQRSFDDAGRAVCDMYYDAKGVQAELWGKQYGIYRDAFDSQGRCIEYSYLDREGRPIVLTAGYSTIKQIYNDAGQAVVEMYYGLDGKQVELSLGHFGIHHAYNKDWQEILTTYLDINGQPMITSAGYASVGKEYINGLISYEWYYDIDGRLVELRRGQCGARYVYIDGKLQRKVPIDCNGNDLFFLDLYLQQHSNVVFLAAGLVMLAALFFPQMLRYALLALYVLFILYMTLYVRESSGNISVSFELFRSYRDFLNNEGTRMQIINNMMLFLPFGFILYLIWPYPAVFLILMGFSVLIESTQMVTGLGWCEIDDVLSNSLGGTAGILVAAIAQKIRIRCGKQLSRE